MKDDFGVYDSFAFINQYLPKDAKLFLFRHVRGYWSDRDYVWGDSFLQGYFDYSTMNADELYKRLKSENITHIAMDTGWITEQILDRLTTSHEDYIWIQDMIEKNSILIYNNTKGAKVYKLKR